MQLVYTAQEMRALDEYVINHLKVPSLSLMEAASYCVASWIRDHLQQDPRQRVTVICGPGNNGGDGYGVARWLYGWGHEVDIVSIGMPKTTEAAQFRDACVGIGVPISEEIDPHTGLFVDALFGTGLTRHLVGDMAHTVRVVNECAGHIVAIDMPSGICADSGALLGAAVRANTTITLGAPKLGLYGEPGADFCGEIICGDIGLGVGVVCGETCASAQIPERGELGLIWPRRNRGGHKGNSGHLLIIAGSVPMAGAAVLCCQGALAAGAGLVTLLAPKSCTARLASLPPEVMVISSGAGPQLEPPKDLNWESFDGVVVGPGLGGGEPLNDGLVKYLREGEAKYGKSMVLDADGLGICPVVGPGGRVITPHPGEAGQLIGITAGQIQADRFSAVRKLTEFGEVAILKGRNSLICGTNGDISINPSGSPVLATAGSGDVLSGVIGALLCRGLSSWDAARLGVYIHGLAGESLERSQPDGWIASDVARGVREAISIMLGTTEG